ncbi:MULTISPECIES: hypothetical protein [unclassified Streptomyces]|uniref:hypothetical protein n=1 Tax=unclassified Streptomyces TaxID=2593676 RepID=UPI002DD8B405|nr:hypothetical protein [Streptomyces sp. NBC_01750]WSB01938.1 hypothetical protein OIE54_23215 [Streptomyces sp. NBC_01794]WSD33794.1 hypothetical protein OG966_18905 [Streptomyces sp. NBC_01750]
MSALAPKGLTWSVLRLHRSALLVTAAFLAASVAALAWVRTIGLEAARGSGPCGSPDSGLPLCLEDFTSSPAHEYSGNMSLASTVIAWLPLAVAVYAGGVLTGRELERGTAALSWTQSVTPSRWLAAKLTLPALLIAAGFAVLSLTYRWARVVGISGSTLGDQWYYEDVFAALGPVDVAYALCGLAIGALSGLLLRRALPAAGLALVVTGFLMMAAERYRDRLWPPVDRVTATPGEMPDSFWQLGNGVVTASGERVGVITSTSRLIRDRLCGDEYGAALAQCRSGATITDAYAVFHPASHFWPLQLVETGIVLALTAAATAAAFLILRRRHA